MNRLHGVIKFFDQLAKLQQGKKYFACRFPNGINWVVKLIPNLQDGFPLFALKGFRNS